MFSSSSPPSSLIHFTLQFQSVLFVVIIYLKMHFKYIRVHLSFEDISLLFLFLVLPQSNDFNDCGIWVQLLISFLFLFSIYLLCCNVLLVSRCWNMTLTFYSSLFTWSVFLTFSCLSNDLAQLMKQKYF